jgi:hypothetical protein
MRESHKEGIALIMFNLISQSLAVLLYQLVVLTIE